MPPPPSNPYPGMGMAPQSELDRYIVDNRLDQGAITLLRNESQEVQRQVMMLGSVANAPNPSAAFMIRLRQVQAQVGQERANANQQPSSMNHGNTPSQGMPGLDALLDKASKEAQQNLALLPPPGPPPPQNFGGKEASPMVPGMQPPKEAKFMNGSSGPSPSMPDVLS